jgi:hypothetical protein
MTPAVNDGAHGLLKMSSKPANRKHSSLVYSLAVTIVLYINFPFGSNKRNDNKKIETNCPYLHTWVQAGTNTQA